MKYTGKSIAIIGCGSSGVAAARLAARLGASPVVVFDSAAPEKLTKATAILEADGLEVVTGTSAKEEAQSRAAHFNLAVISPGIDISWELPTIFTENGVPIIGELEFAWRECRQPVIAITGTNGKTTTTELTALLLQAGGLKTIPCGNYGTPFSEVVMNHPRLDVHTIEVSSFQLETITSFRPSTSVWMNFAADHLDRYPDLESYRKAKLRLFSHQKPEDTAVLNALEPPDISGPQIISFSSRPREIPATYELRDGWIYYQDKPVVHYVTGHLRGRHNAENVMAAMAAAHNHGVPHAAMVDTILSYKSPAHRCELVATIHGREFLNDSKATNLHALASALHSLGQKVVLIAGGKEKGLDYQPLTSLIKNHTTAVVTIGQISDTLQNLWRDVSHCEKAPSLPDAVRAAFALSRPGQTILFSPGTSSFDMFRDYEHRGDVFRETVLQLLQETNV